MAGARAAIRYAKAVLSLATDQKATEAVNSDMKKIVNTVSASPELGDMLQSPVISDSIKKATVLEVFKNSNALTVNLVETLITNKRVALLEAVATQYNRLFDESKGIQVATVTTAVPLTDDLKTKVLAKAKALSGKDVELKNTIDETILGGFILRVGDLQYNASIANQLSKLKREFTLN